MEKYINQRGYALLIVLLTIIIFLSISAVFITSSLNHVKQELTVDQKNQSYVAAEMGVKLISSAVKNQIENKLMEIENTVLTEKKRLELCNTFTTENSNCKTPAEEKAYLNNLKIDQLSMYSNFITNLSNTSLTTYSKENNDIKLSSDVTYYLSSMTLKTIPQNKKQFEILVQGVSNDNESSIKATIEFNELLDIFDITNSQKYIYGLSNSVTFNDVFPETPNITCSALLTNNLSILTKPYNCKLETNQSLSNLKDLISSQYNIKDFNIFIPAGISFNCDNTCRGKDFIGLNLFVGNGDLFSKNLNNLVNANLYVNGNIDAQVANNLGSSNGRLVLVSQGLSVKSSNGVANTSIVLLGKVDKTAQFSITGNNDKFNLEGSSKFCINTDNFSANSLDEVRKIAGNGKIIYYTSNSEFVFSGFNSSLIIQKSTNLKKFLDICEVDSYAVGNGIDIPTINPDLPLPVIADVKYQ
ncbi:hypothetical protein ACFPYN_09890 [Paenisporosarcina macmurdoensis]|uniref:Type 4 fimbrial biogenesis protein PilX N-terminal domain-containing protein n=1 Tax=Paenisporosarcina macmurdoensis TaxID=212659 RepID=A0ABW1L7P4_9BACL